MSERKTGRPSGKAQHIDEVRRLYLKEEWSLGEISDHLGPSVQTLSRWLQSEDIELQARTRNPNAGRTPEKQAEINARISTSVRTSEKKRQNPGGSKTTYEERTCEWTTCENVFRVSVNSPKRFCSMKCVGRSAALHKSQEYQRAWQEDPKSKCQCGNTIPYENRHIWKYCSDVCRQQYGGKRQADPVNWMTKNCRNCGENFQIRKSSQSYGYYCSIACAQTHTKTKKHYAIEGLEIVFDSSYECLFFGLCMFHKIPIERFDRSQCIPYETGHYGPDFVVQLHVSSMPPIYVEIKGYEDEDDVRRCDAWRAQGHLLAVVTQERMGDLLTADPTRFRRALGGYATYGENMRTKSP